MKNANYLYFKSNLKQFREQNHYTCSELAERVGVTPGVISKWENPNGCYPNWEHISILSMIFECKISDFFICTNKPINFNYDPKMLNLLLFSNNENRRLSEITNLSIEKFTRLVKTYSKLYKDTVDLFNRYFIKNENNVRKDLDDLLSHLPIYILIKASDDYKSETIINSVDDIFRENKKRPVILEIKRNHVFLESWVGYRLCECFEKTKFLNISLFKELIPSLSPGQQDKLLDNLANDKFKKEAIIAGACYKKSNGAADYKRTLNVLIDCLNK